MDEDIPEDLLPEDDSIFNDLSARADVSSDALLEESFTEFTQRASGTTSTPSAKTNRRKPAPTTTGSPSPASPRRSARLATPPRHVEPTTNSPRRSARLASPGRSPECSPRRSARLASPARSASLPPCKPPAHPLPKPKPAPKPQKEKGRVAPSTSAKTTRLKCPKCPSTLKCKKTLDAHLRGHLMAGVTSRAPSLQEINQEMLPLITAALKDMIQEPIIGQLSQSVHDYCLTLDEALQDPTLDSELLTYLSESFNEILQSRKSLFPSSIKSSLFIGTNKFLCSPEFRKNSKGYFELLKECEKSVLNVFLGDFMRTLCNKVLVFCMRKMRGELNNNTGPIRKKRSNEKFDSKEFRQTTYHIAGSIVNGFLWKGNRYKETSKAWASFCVVLRENLLVKKGNNASNQCSDEVRHFSDKKDRGGYKHVTDQTLTFFLAVFELLMSLEDEYGSLPSNVIDHNVLVDDVILCIWDDLVGNDLCPDDSLDLLIQICQSCVKVTMKGIIKRRLNKVLKKAHNSVALRASLA